LLRVVKKKAWQVKANRLSEPVYVFVELRILSFPCSSVGTEFGVAPAARRWSVWSCIPTLERGNDELDMHQAYPDSAEREAGVSPLHPGYSACAGV